TPVKEIIFIFLSHNSRLFLPSCFMQSPPNAAQSELPVGCPVAVTRPAEAGHSRGIKPSECHKAGSRGG
ncbi:MAG: hypothetical protein J6M61_08310, partial [Bacteroidales bacterium]|nr:hypothetical protein [Bacteroidales bacterium]